MRVGNRKGAASVRFDLARDRLAILRAPQKGKIQVMLRRGQALDINGHCSKWIQHKPDCLQIERQTVELMQIEYSQAEGLSLEFDSTA